MNNPRFYITIWKHENKLRTIQFNSNSDFRIDWVVNMDFYQKYLFVLRRFGDFEIYDLTKKSALYLKINFLKDNKSCFKTFQTDREDSKSFKINDLTKIKELSRQISDMKLSNDKE